jgi:hypothetical protein
MSSCACVSSCAAMSCAGAGISSPVEGARPEGWGKSRGSRTAAGWVRSMRSIDLFAAGGSSCGRDEHSLRVGE